MEFNKLKDWLKTSPKIEDVFLHLSSIDNTKTLIESIVIDDEILEYISRNSFKHHLGFIRLTLFDFDLFRNPIRLHIWDQDVNNDYIHIHNHNSDYYSYVIVGILVLNIYEEIESSTSSDLEYTKYINPYNAQNYEFHTNGSANIKEKLKVIMSMGSNYFQDNSVFHSVYRQPKKYTSTIFIQSEHQKLDTIIYTKEQLSSNRTNLMLTPRQIKIKLNIFLKHLHDNIDKKSKI